MPGPCSAPGGTGVRGPAVKGSTLKRTYHRGRPRTPGRPAKPTATTPACSKNAGATQCRYYVQRKKANLFLVPSPPASPDGGRWASTTRLPIVAIRSARCSGPRAVSMRRSAPTSRRWRSPRRLAGRLCLRLDRLHRHGGGGLPRPRQARRGQPHRGRHPGPPARPNPLARHAPPIPGPHCRAVGGSAGTVVPGPRLRKIPPAMPTFG